MGTTYALRSGSVIAAPDVSRVPLILGTCRDGSTTETYTYDPGSDPADDLGPGHATALARLLLAAGARVVVAPVAPTYQALPAVVQTGSGPAITLSLTSAAVGPHDDASLLLTVLPGETSMSLCYDGRTEAETITIPPELPAVLRGTVDISGAIPALSGRTLQFTAPAAKTLTFAAGSLAAAPAGLKAATATVAAPVALAPADLLDPGEAAILAHPRRITFTTAGATPSDAPPDCVVTGTGYDGSALVETVTLSQVAGSAETVEAFKTIASIAYAAGDGVGATIAVGYGDAFADAAEVATAFDALAVAAPLAVRARIYEASTGEEYLELYSTGVGTGVTATIDAASTADATLGFAGAGLTDTGEAATLALDWLGITLTFATPTLFEEGTAYAAAIVGPRSTAAANLGALNVAIADHVDRPFGFVVPADTPSSMAVARALWDALVARLDAKLVDADDPMLSYLLCPTALHVASATAATNRTNIATADGALQVAWAGAAKKNHHRVTGDGYFAGLDELPGSHRRPAVWAAADAIIRIVRTAGNPCDQKSLACSMVGPDGATKARDERFATTKFGGLSASLACWALKTASDGSALFCPSASAAGPTSTLRSPGAIAIAWAMGRAMQAQLAAWEGTWPTDPTNPAAANPDLIVDREAELFELLRPVFWPGEQGEQNLDTINVSGTPQITISAPNIKNDGEWTVGVAWNDHAVAESCTVTFTATTAALGGAEGG